MRFSTQDPDIETIVRRIEENDYDLQPDFQRGDVWTPPKQKRLIDSVLRGWHIPPVHLVARAGGLSDVLDGQQRLTAIRDFLRGDFAIDGSIEPHDAEIKALHGLRYGELPDQVKKRIKRFTIRVFELTDYSPDEPHELFFRLNQPTNLTEAEKRNAFIGLPRNQVKDLVRLASAHGMTVDRVGFSNARMAYDDVLARVLATLEASSLDAKVTAARITERYRRDNGFAGEIIDAATQGLLFFLSLTELDHETKSVRPNKATVHTWLCIASQLAKTNDLNTYRDSLHDTIVSLEENRWTRPRVEHPLLGDLLVVFQDRSTARVADVSSVVIRDLIAWMILTRSRPTIEPVVEKYEIASRAWSMLTSDRDIDEKLDDQLFSFATENKWGTLGWD
jgi:hypothetical protein